MYCNVNRLFRTQRLYYSLLAVSTVRFKTKHVNYLERCQMPFKNSKYLLPVAHFTSVKCTILETVTSDDYCISYSYKS